MNIIERFFILFGTDAKQAGKDVDELGKKLDDTEKKVNDNDESTRKLGVTFTDLTTSILAAGAAVGTFAKAKDLFFSGVDWAAQVQRISQITGESAKQIAVWDSVIQDAGGNQGDFTSFFTQTAKQFQEAGLGANIKNIIPSLLEFRKEIQNVDMQTAITMGHLRGIPDTIVAALKSANFDDLLAKEGAANAILDISGQRAQNFSNALKEITRQGYQFGVSLIPAGEAILKLISEIGTVGNKVFETVLTPIFNGIAWLAGIGGSSSATSPPTQHASASGATRGIRNNNPGNLRSWFGTDSDGGYARFDTPEQGLRAEMKQLELYGRRGIDTISAIVAKWAPAGDNNNVEAYIQAMERSTGFGRDQALDLSDPRVRQILAHGINLHENGIDAYSAAQYAAAANAGISAADNTPLNSASVNSGGSNKTLTVGTIIVQTQATDADGIARAIHGTLNEHLTNTVNTLDDGVAK